MSASSGRTFWGMQEIDFFELPRAVQDRLLAALGGEFEPTPLLVTPGPRPLPLRWLGAAGFAALALGALWWLGFGDATSALASHPLPVGTIYVALAGLLAWSLLQLAAHRAARQALPFPPGVYLFATGLIDARQARLRVYPLASLTDVSVGGPETLVVRFGATTFRFAVRAHDRERLAESVREASRRMALDDDDDERRRLDPLSPPRVVSPLSTEVPLRDTRPRWIRARWLVAALVALTGVPLYLLRDQLSDASMFARAREADDVPAYQRYLARGRAHRNEVGRVLLPRAALRDAVAAGTVEALEQFVAAHPETDIQQEIDRALQAARRKAFEQAEQQGTLAALLEFEERHPEHGLTKPLAEARHAVYVRAAAAVREKVPPASKQVARFVGPLIAAAERSGARRTDAGVRGPTVAVRMRRIPSRAVEGADDLVRRNPWFAGEVSFPSRYVAESFVEPHEARAAAALAESFAGELDPEILTFRVGEALDGSAPLPEVGAPTLVVSYRVEPSGGGYASKKPRCVFVGLVFFFETTFLLPGDEPPLVIHHTAAMRVPSKLIASHDDAAPRGSLEKAVYDEMLRGGFAEGGKRYRTTWFGQSE